MPIPPLSCALGMETVTYTPGLTNQPRLTTSKIEGDVSGCITTPDDTEAIASGTYNFTLQTLNSCNYLVASLPPYTITYNWNNGQSSTIYFSTFNRGKVGG
ncbi:MAG: hypothetical protein RMY28_031480 [Nostoc sp. ChiSLP01]|nr:hypothetical protein [Nostoc sp. CmiSLP01]MDZ8283318.1 hypothetical protein [Nostoc sp. ChiSLP01]